MKLIKDNLFLMVIDVQEKIFRTMYEKADTKHNIEKIIEGAKTLGLPIVWTEQYSKGLGPTIETVRKKLAGYKRLGKISFSCLGDKVVMDEIISISRKQALLCGIEAHVCVYQTARDLMEKGFETHIVTDAVMSRKESNYQLALDKLRDIGAELTSVETALFELLGSARDESFKAISKIIK